MIHWPYSCMNLGHWPLVEPDLTHMLNLVWPRTWFPWLCYIWMPRISRLWLLLPRCCSLFHSEAFRAPIFRSGPDRNGFNLGTYANFKEVFGNRKFLWFFPVFTAWVENVYVILQLVISSVHISFVSLCMSH